jgi:hypothetical protein
VLRIEVRGKKIEKNGTGWQDQVLGTEEFTVGLRASVNVYGVKKNVNLKSTSLIRKALVQK